MNNKISFAGLITTITEDSGENRSYTRHFVREMALIIREGLLRDGTVNLSGFGIFKLHDVPARNGRNIQTGASLLIPAHRKVMFKPEKSLRELINKRYAHLRPQIIEDAPQKKAALSETPQREITGSFFSSVFADETEEKKEIKREENIPEKEPFQPSLQNEKKEEIKPVAIPDEQPQGKPVQEPVMLSTEEAQSPKRNRTGMYLSIVAILMVLFFYWQMQKSDVDENEIVEKTSPEKQHPKKSESLTKKQTSAAETKATVAKSPPVAKTVKKAPEQNTVTYERQSHHTAFGDNLWKLAYQHYHDGYLWPLILLENHKKIKNPDFVKTGIVLDIPALTITNNKPDAATRTLLARGHLLAYKSFKAMGRKEAVNHLYAANKYDAAYVRSMIPQIDRKDLLAIHVK